MDEFKQTWTVNRKKNICFQFHRDIKISAKTLNHFLAILYGIKSQIYKQMTNSNTSFYWYIKSDIFE